MGNLVVWASVSAGDRMSGVDQLPGFLDLEEFQKM